MIFKVKREKGLGITVPFAFADIYTTMDLCIKRLLCNETTVGTVALCNTKQGFFT
jgi:hypothetical protein